MCAGWGGGECVGGWHGGGRLQLVLMRHPPGYLSKLGGRGLGGAVGGGGGRLEGVWGVWPGGPKGGGAARATHYYHMHTSRGDVCLRVWGYIGM